MTQGGQVGMVDQQPYPTDQEVAEAEMAQDRCEELDAGMHDELPDAPPDTWPTDEASVKAQYQVDPRDLT